MIDNQEPILIGLDPVWSRESQVIRKVSKMISSGPRTRVGEEIKREILLKSSIFQAYPRLGEVFDALISLTEFDEIGKLHELVFNDSKNQQIVLRAFGLLIEDVIKAQYLPEEEKSYDDYRPFFEGLLRRLKGLDLIIEGKKPLPNFIASLFLVTSQEVNKLGGIYNFSLNYEIISKRIKNYLPELNNIDQGEIFRAIKDQMEEALKKTSSNQN